MVKNLKLGIGAFGIPFFLLASGVSAFAGDLTLKVTAKEPPAELDASIRATLQPEAVQLLDGEKPIFEFWFRRDIPLNAKPDPANGGLQAVKAATLIGAAAVRENRRDYKDNDLYSGVYTIRFSLQPQDGNHLGTADYPFFAVLVLAKFDSKLDGIADYKTLVKASAKETSSDHPVILSLRPSASPGDEAPKVSEPAQDHKSLRVKVPAVAPGGEKAALTFELVYEGKGKL